MPSEQSDTGPYHPHEADKAADEVQDELLTSDERTVAYIRGVEEAVTRMKERWKAIHPDDREGDSDA